MRYYNVQILNDDGSSYKAPSGLPTAWNSLNTLQIPDPAAANVIFDIPLYAQNNSQGACHLKIEGVGLPLVSQATNFAPQNGIFKTLSISLGMSKGLPLANPAQVGAPITGQITQAYGNWQGVNQSIEFNFAWTPATPLVPQNITFTWAKGQSLQDAISAAISQAFPADQGYTTTVAIDSRLVAPQDLPGQYQNTYDFMAEMNKISRATLNDPNYPGVQMYVRGKNVSVFDWNSTGVGGLAEQTGGTLVGRSKNTGSGTSESDPKQIAFTDLIGQPVWQNVSTIQFHCVMRGDIAPNTYIKMPLTTTLSNAGSNAQYRNNLTFQGAFAVTRVRLVGNFRQPSAESWVAVIDATSLVKQ